MKLYRHHTAEFQKIIENSEVFQTDESRRFNFDKKNRAEFYFYSLNIACAEDYKVEEDFGTPTELFTYEAEPKLIDLRNKKDIEKLGESFLQNLANLDNEVKASVFSNYERQKTCKKELKQIDSLNKNSVFTKTTLEDVLNDNPYNGRSFFNQTITDYDNGEELKKIIIKLGFDGVIIKGSIKGDEVALLNPAKRIK